MHCSEKDVIRANRGAGRPWFYELPVGHGPWRKLLVQPNRPRSPQEESYIMKVWLKRLWIIPALIAVVVAGFAMAEHRYSYPVEPELCALCNRGYVHRALVLFNLATGEIAEMEVYESDPLSPNEIDKTRTGVASFSFATGVQVVMDAGRSASVILPGDMERMDY